MTRPALVRSAADILAEIGDEDDRDASMGPLFDAAALKTAVDSRRGKRTWTEVATEIGLDHYSCLTRLGTGAIVTPENLIRILLWLGTTDLAPYIRKNVHDT